MKANESAESASSDDGVRLASVEERFTEELVVGFVGPVGSGVTTCSNVIGKILADEFGYKVNPIKISSIIQSCTEIGNAAFANEFDRIREYQKAGNSLRERYGNDFLSRKVVENIASFRRTNNGYINGDGGIQIPTSLRTIHIIDSIKHPEEYSLLRAVYSDAFFLFGVFAPQEIRKKRLEDKNLSPAQCEEVMEIDENEPDKFGQKVRKTIEIADFFLRNDHDSDDMLTRPSKRFIDLLFGVGNHSPSIDEKGMLVAKTSATASACLSRQVGAAIYSDTGELIGTGSNDVPRAKGGLYRYEDGEEDKRCFRWKDKKCHNDYEKSILAKLIVAELSRKIENITEDSDIEEIILSTRLGDLIEFSRAVHAEMEAIVSVARSGKQGIVGGSMYTTTFPCHNCARHIVASGITKVTFIEAYPKSLAIKLHDDSITTSSTSNDSRVQFIQFQGVSPKNVVKFFGSGQKRKLDGRVIEKEKRTATPIAEMPLDGFSTREDLVVDSLGELEDAENETGQAKRRRTETSGLISIADTNPNKSTGDGSRADS